MQTSSPLAAMHQPAAHTFGHPDIFRPSAHAVFHGDSKGSGALLRERLRPGGKDYFNVKGVSGSSPTASLAADLSANFRIDNDASPQFPTPRRALFTTNAIMGALEGQRYQTTPPLPASSPAYTDMDMDMDMSPLPMGKGIYVSQVEVHSPSPTPSPEDDQDMALDSPAPISRHSSVDGTKPMAENRRTLNLRRPSLTRSKGYSTGNVPNRLHPEGQLSSFKFGNDGRPGSSSSQMSLSECFEDSPPQERRPQSANSPCAAAGALRSKAHFSSLSGASTRNGSPINGHSRRGSNPHLRPRKQYRRSLSMFESAGDVIKPKEDLNAPSGLQSVLDVEEAADPVLPHFFPEDQNDSIPRVSRDTFLDILDGKYNEHYDHRLIIDCRFEYEYDGGHVDRAINYNDKELLASHLFNSPMEGRTLLLFHCEYSVHRAPLMARHIRALDRTVNAESYPRLTYPEVYILEGGYSGFFAEHRQRCYPQAYVEMDAAEHARTCEKEMDRLRHARKGLGRAQTYAFGEREHSALDSPTAGQRYSCDDSPMQLGDSPSVGHDRGHARRMASY